MTSIREAKKHLRDRYRHIEGFVGIGIEEHDNEEILCVYVADRNSIAAQQLEQTQEFEGFPMMIEVTGEAQALSALHQY